jgi:hypothetical protein
MNGKQDIQFLLCILLELLEVAGRVEEQTLSVMLNRGAWPIHQCHLTLTTIALTFPVQLVYCIII